MSVKLRVFIICIFFILSACRKVIDLKLKSSDIKYVVEAVISNEPGSCRVFVSKSKPFNQDNQFENVSGALIQVTDNGQVYNLEEKQPGIYENIIINGTPGHIYELSVRINNNVFTGTCAMPQKVRMDSLYISRGPFCPQCAR